MKEKGIAIRVMPVVVLVSGKISSIVGETNVFISEDYKLPNHIFNLSPVPDWSSQLAEKIKVVLKIEYNEV